MTTMPEKKRRVMRGKENRQKIIAFIKSFHENNGYYPTFEEIREGAEISSTSVVHFHVKRLRESGIIKTHKTKGVSRALIINNDYNGEII